MVSSKKEAKRYVYRDKGVARRNASTKKVFLTSGLKSKTAVFGKWDGRCVAEKARRAYAADYTAHLGGEVNVVQADLVDMASRLKVLANLAYTRLLETGVFDQDGNMRELVDDYRRLESQRLDLLRNLGVARHAKQITFQDIMAGRANLPSDEVPDED